MNISFSPDNPVFSLEEDFLDYKVFANQIKNSIYNTKTPFVFGLLGDWGTGKTSLLKLLELLISQDLDQNAKNISNTKNNISIIPNNKLPQLYIPIWFNAWEYENEANILYPLLHAVKIDHKKRIPPVIDEKNRFLESFKKIAKTTVLTSADIALRVATKSGLEEIMPGIKEGLKLSDAKDIFNMSEQIPTNQVNTIAFLLDNWVDGISGIKEQFKRLLDSYAEDIVKKYCEKNTIYQKESIKFVILIDDLDRCLPETTISILEKIKNYLCVENCIFVLATNYKIVYKAIRAKYKDLDLDGRQYLEKILNYSFYLPEPKAENLTNFIKEKLEKPIEALNPNDTFKSAIDMFSSTTIKCSFSNPRKIKRIFNRYIFFLEKNSKDIKDNKFNLENIVKLIILAEYYQDIFQLLLDVSGSITEDLNKLGSNSFKVKEFEEKFGISIFNIYPQMIKMRQLFSLISSTKSNRYSLIEEVRHVYEVTTI